MRAVGCHETVGPSGVHRDPGKNRANATRIFEWVQAGKLRPHVDVVAPFTGARDALERMEKRRIVGKLMLVP